jgi:hypothetical protein
MGWMNAYEIEAAVIRISGPPRLAKAARFLKDFKDLIDEISDGWPYWSYGTRCSEALQGIVSNGVWPANAEPPPAAEIDAAVRKVRSFLARCDQTKDKPAVREFLSRWT